MKLLLDENLPHKLRRELPGHEVFTVAFMGWAGVENGDLLRLAAQSGFNALITNDRGLEYEQNIATLPVAVVVLLAKRNTAEAVLPLCPMLIDALGRLRPRELVKVSEP